MSEKHSGPWQALPWEAANGGTDWNVWGPKRTNHLGDGSLSGDYGSEHDAHLMAAAPEMYEALEKADEELANAGWRETQWPRPQIAAALRKARGEA